MRPPLVTPAALASGLALLLGPAPAVEAAHGYDYFVVGDPLSAEAGVLTSSRSEVY